MRRIGPRAMLAIAAALTLTFTGVASASYNLIEAKLAGDTKGPQGYFRAELKINGKGIPRKLTFISVDHPDLTCTPSDEPSFKLDFLGFNLATAKLKKQGTKYAFLSDEGGSSTASGKVTKNGRKLTGELEIETIVTDESTGEEIPCRGNFKLTGKSIYESG